MEENKMPVTAQSARLYAALTQNNLSIQKIQDGINSLVFNADHLPTMKQYLKGFAEIEKVITEAHKTGKAPAKAECDAWDEAKRSLVALVETLRQQVKVPHDRISKEEDDKRIAAEREIKRKKDTAIMIEQKIIAFSTQIAECDTTEKLLSVERNINLEKSSARGSTYMEFHDEAKKRFDAVLLPMIKLQKDKIKEKESLAKALADAEKNDDVKKIDELKQKQEEIDNEITQIKVDVQLSASQQESIINADEAQEVFQDVNAVNHVKFEIVDLKAVVKNAIELLDYKLKFRETQKIAMALKDAGTFKDKSEVVVNGIKFFIDKTFKA